MSWIKKLDNVSVKVKFTVGMWLMLVLIFALISVSFYKSSLLNKAQDATGYVDHLVIYMLKARRSEKDFIMRKDIKYVDKNKEDIKKIIYYLDILDDGKWGKTCEKELVKLRDAVTAYSSLFADVVNLEIKRGVTSNDGIRYAFREATHTVESLIKARSLPAAVMVQMLMCRRREKDYVIRGDEKYVKKLAIDVATLKNILIENGANDLVDGVEKYHNGFMGMVQIDREIKQKTGEFRDKIHGYEQLLETLEMLIGDETTEEIFIINLILLISSILAVIFTVIITYILIISITSPINQLVTMTGKIASNDLTEDVNIGRKDEFGDLLNNFDIMVKSLRGIIGSIMENVAQTSTSATELAATSEELAATSEEISAQSQTVSSASEQSSANLETMGTAANSMSMNVTTVATAIEEMSASLNEVSKNCQKEREISAAADESAKGIQREMDELGNSAQQISKVVEVINDIADQTNLLALNATIEAASAGEAGKGFAVVANEIKELAKQTAQATEEISTQVGGMQDVTARSIKSIGGITNTIGEINDISHNIVSAVEEQSATINEISSSMGSASSAAEEIARGISEASTGIVEITTNIAGVNEGVKASSEGVNTISSMAEQLSISAEELNVITQKFTV